MKLSLIVAAAENGVIGKDNQMPWHLPEDLKYFKRITMGKPVVMGRKTFESIGRPLPGRPNIVITRNTDYQAQGADVLHDLSSAEAHCEDLAVFEDFGEVMIIGGAELYRQALPEVDRIYLTRVHADVEGDTSFPVFDESHWQVISREFHSADSKNSYDYSFLILDRIRAR